MGDFGRLKVQKKDPVMSFTISEHSPFPQQSWGRTLRIWGFGR